MAKIEMEKIERQVPELE